MNKQKSEFTFRHNLKHGRHGWLRLTPAYSIKLVRDILDRHPEITYVLDPFSGTGTTGLVCGERGISCDLFDINPFLVWFAEVKTANYRSEDLHAASAEVRTIIAQALGTPAANTLWFPPISNIERWWSKDKLLFLAKLFQAINQFFPHRSGAKDLLFVAFSRLVIESSNAAFNHQSMSFKEESIDLFQSQHSEILANRFIQLASEIILSAEEPILGRVTVKHADSRHVPKPRRLYDAVITSPPYPNRMSYIRELRPYMYWLGYLNEAREAAEIDWQAIGGTWGIATSRLLKWKPNGIHVPHDGFATMIEDIKRHSPLLANYVHKYFVDTTLHFESLREVIEPNAKVFYVVGNSKFYDTLVPVELLYASILENAGFREVNIEILRKRNSKKELLEFVVSARKL